MNKNILSIIIIGFLLMGIVSAYSWNDLDEGIIAYYSFEGNDLSDIATGNNNGTNEGTENTTGIIGDGRRFYANGSSYMRVGAGTIALTDGNFTMNFWQYVSEESTSSSGLLNGENGWCIGRYSAYYESSPKVVGFGKCGVNEVRTTTELENQTWNMITIVYDTSADEVSFYINGVADSSNPQAYSSTIGGGIEVYFGVNAPPTWAEYNLNGTLDEVGVWGRALNSSEVGLVYYSITRGCSYGDDTCFIEEETPPAQFSSTGQVIYDSMNTAGAGLGIFMQIMSVALPLLVLGLGVVAVIVIIAYSLVGILKR